MKIREKFFKWFFLASDKYRAFILWISGLCRFFLIISLIMFILCFLFYIGFNYTSKTSEELLSAFRILFLVIFLSKYIQELLNLKKTVNISLVFRALILLYALGVFLANFNLVNYEKNFWHTFYGEN
jgi:hypothetical protein